MKSLMAKWNRVKDSILPRQWERLILIVRTEVDLRMCLNQQNSVLDLLGTVYVEKTYENCSLKM